MANEVDCASEVFAVEHMRHPNGVISPHFAEGYLTQGEPLRPHLIGLLNLSLHLVGSEDVHLQDVGLTVVNASDVTYILEVLIP
jgi:hypothetical protein